MTTTQRWLRCPQPKPDATIRLLCLPHAGGSASLFARWGADLAAVEVHAVTYPGRADRIDEPVPTDLVELAGDIASAAAPLADRPLALFGHSMGAAVALETARALEAAGIPVAHLFASGSRNGPLPQQLPPPSEDPADIARQLVQLGGTDPELAEDPIFQELVLPFVLGDGQMFHSYRMRPAPLLGCAVTSIVGSADADADVRPWAELAPGRFAERAVEGEHFYLMASPPYDLIASALASYDDKESHT